MTLRAGKILGRGGGEGNSNILLTFPPPPSPSLSHRLVAFGGDGDCFCFCLVFFEAVLSFADSPVDSVFFYVSCLYSRIFMETFEIWLTSSNECF